MLKGISRVKFHMLAACTACEKNGLCFNVFGSTLGLNWCFVAPKSNRNVNHMSVKTLNVETFKSLQDKKAPF